MKTLLPVFCGCLLVAGLALAEEPAAPKLEWQLKKPGDAIAAKIEAAGAVLTITSQTGIGGAEVKLAGGTWPKQITLHFAKFPALENFTVQNGTVRLEGRLGFNDKEQTLYFDAKGTEIDKEKEAAYTLKLRRNAADQRLEVELPAGFVPATSKSFQLGWIDAYRG